MDSGGGRLATAQTSSCMADASTCSEGRRGARIGDSKNTVRFAGFEYSREAWRNASDEFETLVVPFWAACALSGVVPALWLWRYRRDRRVRSDGMPHCAKCDYNLTGNVSGICPECGTPIPANLVRGPVG